ncbi:hypothetical protein [Clostridium sp. YIM B02506]|uniref:hypothetical protein n=1 Tax=Clostridium sp. YIM B02506 TaxID=2910680 RepID=UPI001EEE0D6E|nr:hypothetical protein [Clostridium sp. YIM B02506]
MRVFHGTPEIRSKEINREKIIKATTNKIAIHNNRGRDTDTTRGYVYLSSDKNAAGFFSKSSLLRLNSNETDLLQMVCIYELEIDEDKLECDQDQCKLMKEMNINNCPNLENYDNCQAQYCIKYIKSIRVKGDISLEKNLIKKDVININTLSNYKYHFELKKTK